MAFGFRRLPGKARNYQAVDAPGYSTGQTLSRKAYDKYVAALGKKQSLPGVDAIQAASRLLDSVKADLDALAKREAEVSAREAALDERERRLALEARALELEREQARLQSRHAQGSAQARGLRRHYALLEAYLAEQRRQGRTITPKQAQQSAEFKEIVRNVKGIPNKKGDPFIAAENKARRLEAFGKVGGALRFREIYEELYGIQLSGEREHRRFGVDRTGRSTGFRVRRHVA